MSTMRKRRRIKKLVKLGVLLILVLALLFSGLQILESTVLRNAEDEPSANGTKTIERDGVEYFPRQD